LYVFEQHDDISMIQKTIFNKVVAHQLNVTKWSLVLTWVISRIMTSWQLWCAKTTANFVD